MLDETGSHLLIEYGIDLFGNDGVGTAGAGGDWSGVRGDGHLEWEKGSRIKVSLRRGENTGQFAKDVAQGRDY